MSEQIISNFSRRIQDLKEAYQTTLQSLAETEEKIEALKVQMEALEREVKGKQKALRYIDGIRLYLASKLGFLQDVSVNIPTLEDEYFYISEEDEELIKQARKFKALLKARADV